MRGDKDDLGVVDKRDDLRVIDRRATWKSQAKDDLGVIDRFESRSRFRSSHNRSIEAT